MSCGTPLCEGRCRVVGEFLYETQVSQDVIFHSLEVDLLNVMQLVSLHRRDRAARSAHVHEHWPFEHEVYGSVLEAFGVGGVQPSEYEV